MSMRYPGYDVLAKRETPSWNAATRKAVEARLAVPAGPRFFTPEAWATLTAVCARILPQSDDRPPVPLAAYVDEKLYEDRRDGYRLASLPPQGEAWRRGLAALDAEARRLFGAGFAALPAERQDELLQQMQDGVLKDPAWGDMPCADFFKARVLADVTRLYYAHPSAWSEIGFGGPASPRGYVRLGADQRDPWEAAEARPSDGGSGEAERALRENRRVGRR